MERKEPDTGCRLIPGESKKSKGAEELIKRASPFRKPCFSSRTLFFMLLYLEFTIWTLVVLNIVNLFLQYQSIVAR
jgi:hypothetical protein